MHGQGSAIGQVQETMPALREIADRPRTILVAEDEHLLARGLMDELTLLGYEVLGPAGNGRRAIEIAEQQRPDMVLMDIRMPDMDGLEAGRVLFGQMHLPVVILSAYSDGEYVESAAALGVFGYLLKPVNLDCLRVTIAVAWGRYRNHITLSNGIMDLESKLQNRKLIEKAKGVLMADMGLTEADAMHRLQKQARDSRRPMVELAKAILDEQNPLRSGGHE